MSKLPATPPRTPDWPMESAMDDALPGDLRTQIAALSSAEDFFRFFMVPYDKQVLNVCRLHILKRMGEYLDGSDFSGMSDDEIFLATSLHLKRAYIDFVKSTPQQEKVFQVFKRVPQRAAPAFVDLADLKVAAE